MSTNDGLLLTPGKFAGPLEFAQAVRAMIDMAAQQQWSRMVWCDVNFEGWPLRERAVIESLNAWAGPGRQLLLLAKSFQLVPVLHPRFAQWRGTWSHLVECRVVKHLGDSEVPSVILGPAWYLRRTDVLRSVGICSQEVRNRIELTELLDEVKKQSAPGFPVTTLGL